MSEQQAAAHERYRRALLWVSAASMHMAAAIGALLGSLSAMLITGWWPRSLLCWCLVAWLVFSMFRRGAATEELDAAWRDLTRSRDEVGS